jgi:hypothetical protein
VKRNRLTLGKVSEISLVDRGDNPTADVLIHKRAPGGDVTPPAPAPAAADPGESFGKRLVAMVAKLIGRPQEEVQKDWDEAASFSDVYEEVDWWPITTEVWEMTSALSDSISRTLRDTKLSAADKAVMITTSQQQFDAALTAAIATWSTGQKVKKTAPGTCPDCGAQLPDGATTCPECEAEIAKAGRKLSADRRTRLEGAKAALDAILAETDVTPTTDATMDATKNAPAGGAPPAGAEADVLKGLTPEAQQFVKAAEARAAAAEGRANEALAAVEKADEDRAVEVLTKRVAEGGDLFGIGVDVATLRVIQKTQPDAFAKLEEGLKATAERIQKGDLFKEIGSSGAGAGSNDGMTALKAKAAELRAADSSLSEPQAIAKAADLFPELAGAARDSIRGGN